METIHVKRLEKLATHLEKAKLAHEKFNFNVFNSGRRISRLRCASEGCAIGECPAVFPRQWKWHQGSVSLTNGHPFEEKRSAMEFFGLTMEDATKLFYPTSRNEDVVGRLKETATRFQVAAGIREFLFEKVYGVAR